MLDNTIAQQIFIERIKEQRNEEKNEWTNRPWDHLCSIASMCNIGLLNSQIFFKKPLSEGPHRAQGAGTAPALTCTDPSQGKAGNTTSCHGFLTFLFTYMVRWLLSAPSTVGHPVGCTFRKKLLSPPIVRVVV